MVVGDARSLLHVVGDDHDRVALLELVDQLLDLQRRDRIERRAGLVHQDHLGLDRDRAGDAQALLLAAGEADPGVVEAILDLVPEADRPQRVVDPLAQSSLPRMPASFSPAATLSKIDIVGNGLAFWKTIPIRRRTAVTSTWAP